MSEEHGTLIKTPKQLIIVCAVALVVPVAIAVLGAQLVSGSKHIDPTESKKSVEQRIRPVGEIVKFDGAPPPVAAAAVTTVALKAKSGEEVYNGACVACHGAGIAGAPKTGDKALWAPRIAQGASTLYKHAIEGFKAMPAKGGQAALSDDEVKAAVDYQIAKSK
jgi:cytochrome c5